MGRLTIAAYYGLTGVLTSLWGASLPAVDARLGMGEGRLGVVLLLVALSGLAAMPPAGRAAARRPGLLRTAAPAAAAGLLGPALAPSAALLAASAVVFGALLGTLNMALSVTAVAVERRLARPVMSTLHGVWTLGAAAGGALTAAALAAGVDVRTVTASGAAALAAGLLLLGRTGSGAPRRRAGRSGTPAGAVTGSRAAGEPVAAAAGPVGGGALGARPGGGPGGAGAGGRGEPRGDTGVASATLARASAPPEADRAAHRRAAVVRLGLIGAAAFLTEGAATDWSGIHARRVLAADQATASLVYTAFWTAMTVARFLGDAARSALGAAATLRLAGATATAGYALVLLAPAAGGLRIAAAMGGWSLAGAGMALVWPVVASTAGAAAGGAGHLPWVTTLSTAGGLLGPVLIGFVAAGTSLRTALLIPAALALAVTATAPRTITSYTRATAG